MTSEASRDLIAALSAEGTPARFVGGCVRDGIIGRAVKDIDIATPTRPDDVIRLLDAAGIRSVPTGLAHGTVTAVIDHSGFEVTTLRRDVETDGRRAVVAFTDDWAADAARRDFTMNAIFCDADGTLYDPMGGVADLRAGRVRFVGSAQARIAEDVLRLLRFFRFHAWYGKGEPDPEAIAACRAMTGELRGLSAERIWAELSRTLLAPDPATAFALMDDVGVLAEVLPEAHGVDRLAAAVTAEAALGLEPSAIRRLAAAIEGEADAIAALGRRLRMSRTQAERLSAAIDTSAGLAPDLDDRAVRIVLYSRGTTAFADALIRAQAADSGADDRWRGLATALAGWTRPRFPLKGADVMAAGIPSGPEVGRLLDEVEEWWLNEGFTPDRAACLARLTGLIAD